MAMQRRGALVIDLGGVLVRPGVIAILQRENESPNLVSGFLQSFLTKNSPTSPIARVTRGEITFSQFLFELEEEFKNVATKTRAYIPPHFSAAQTLADMLREGEINKPLLRVAGVLKNLGFKTCVLTNDWVDDSHARHCTAHFLSMLNRHFDYVIESCRIGMIKPDRKIYQYLLDKLKTKPQETYFLDDSAANLKPAREMGLRTIHFQDTERALRSLQNLTGVQLIDNTESCPTGVNPDDIVHCYVKIRPDVRMHYVEMGNGPVVLLCHGFPESWYSWRYQIIALVDSGYRVIALDMKGYGESTAPLKVEEYSQEVICKDLTIFLHKLAIPQATFIGHDWGAIVAWNMALFYPEKVRAVVGVNTPFTHCTSAINVREKLEKLEASTMFDYQNYFQKEGVAEAELEENLARTFKVMFRGSKADDQLSHGIKTTQTREKSGFLSGTPADPPMSKVLREEDLAYYISQFKRTGFRGPLNWYRNIEKNWDWGCTVENWKINVPALMITAGKDKVLSPKMSSGMEMWIPQLTRGHIEECGHWTLFERPSALNETLTTWLDTVHATPLTCARQ